LVALTRAVVGYVPKEHLRVVLGGVKVVPPELPTGLDALLAKVVKQLRFG
jgi:hypothetical protein